MVIGSRRVRFVLGDLSWRSKTEGLGKCILISSVSCFTPYDTSLYDAMNKEVEKGEASDQQTIFNLGFEL